MIWTKPGQQYDQEAEIIINMFKQYNKRIYLYGAGSKGYIAYHTLKEYDCFAGFIDSDLSKQEQGYLGEQVFSLETFLQDEKNQGWIVISAINNYQLEIEEILVKHNLVHKKDYFYYDEMFLYYFPILAAYYFDSCLISLCQICLTERCTLKCEKCAHGCYNVSFGADDMSWKDFCLSVETFFGKVDYVTEFVLIGGEPLLYKRLAEAIQYIGERYRDKIGIFSITTNGTIIPEHDVLVNSKKYSIIFRISNYTKELPQLLKQHEKLLNVLDDEKIKWNMPKPDVYWQDYGFETVYHTWSDKKMIDFFDICKSPCREIRRNRFYYCVMARSVSDNLGYGVGEDDYLDFDCLEENYKMVILEYELGYSKKGYLDMCRRCNGYQTVDAFKIPVARQIVRG